MQFLKLTGEQKKISAWRRKRNRLVSELLTANPRMLSRDALEEANRIMSGKGSKPTATAETRKRAVLTCRHCGGKRPAGELFCAGCSSPWVVVGKSS